MHSGWHQRAAGKDSSILATVKLAPQAGLFIELLSFSFKIFDLLESDFLIFSC